MKRILLSAALVLTGAPLLAHADSAVTEVCNAGPCSGEAAIENGNKKLAREQALEAALRDALVKGAGAELDSATETEGGTLLQDRIFMHANGYVKGYQLEDDREDDGTWVVKISHVKVGTGDLSRDVQAVKAEIARQGHPRLYALIREQSIESVTGDNPTAAPKDKKAAEVTPAALGQGVVQEALVSHLRPLGWKFVDPEVASGKVHVENALTTDLQNLNGRDFATTGADYVILGSVVVRPEKAGGMTGNALSTVLVRTVLYVKSTDTGDTVASVEKTSPVSSALSLNEAASKAMEQAGSELAEALQKQVLETWRANRNGVGKVMLSVAVADYDVLQAFEEQLQKGVANVKAVDEVSYNDGKAEIAVSMAGTSPKQLAGSLSHKSVKGMQVKVTRVTTNTVEVKLVK